MTGESLLNDAQDAFDEGDYLRALGCFLRAKERRLDLAHSWDLGGSVVKISLCDVDSDTTKEIGALSTTGKFATYSLYPKPSEEPAAARDCRSFRFLQRTGGVGVILLSEQRGMHALSLHEYWSHGNGLHLRWHGDLRPPIDREAAGDILDIVAKNLKLYISTNNQSIYEYNAVTLEAASEPHEVGEVVLRLNTGALGSPYNMPGGILHNKLLGSLRGGGLIVFDVSAGNFRESKRTSDLVEYVDTYIDDADNDGIPEVIACTQNGYLHIRDWYSLDVRFTASCPDQFSALYCDDIDGDGVLEILVGARSNRIYVFAVEPNRELRLKWEFPTEHRVTDLWVGDVQANEKRLVIGLANGKVQVFKIPRTRDVNRGIAQSFLKLSEHTPQHELQQLFFQRGSPEIVQFGLDKWLAQDMDCSTIVELLERVEQRSDYQASLHVLSRLKTCLARCIDDKGMILFAVDFINDLYNNHHDLPTCEHICATFDEILQGKAGGSKELSDLFAWFHRERLRWKEVRSRRVEYIRSLVAKGRLDVARDELETLKLVGLDLLKSFRTGVAEGIEAILPAGEDDRLAFTTREHRLVVVDGASPIQLFSRDFRQFELHCCHLPLRRHRFLAFDNRTAIIFDEDYRESFCCIYHAPVVCASAASRRGAPFWAVGLEDGTVVLEGLAGARLSLQVPTCPAGVSLQLKDDGAELWIITVDGNVYRHSDALRRPGAGEASRQPETTPVPDLELGPSFNVLDWVPLDGNVEATRFIALSPTGLRLIREIGGRLTAEPIEMGKHLSCIAVGNEGSAGRREVIVGTHDRSLIFVSTERDDRKEVYLPDIPTALHVVKEGEHANELVVGFAQGGLNRYRRIGRKELEELERLCDETRDWEHRKDWDGRALRDKLVLIALAPGGSLDMNGIHAALDPKIGQLISKEELVPGVKALSHDEVIQEHVDEAVVRYRIRDEEYAEWIDMHHDPFQTARANPKELIGAIRVADLWRIEPEAAGEGETPWLADFLLIDPKRCSQLVCLSKLLNLPDSAPTGDSESPGRAYLEAFCASIEAVCRFALPVPADQALYLTKYEIQIPTVKFDGFDRILVVVLGNRGRVDPQILDEIGRMSDLQIVVVLTARDGDPLRNILKPGSFGVAVLDQHDLKAIILAESPRETFLDMLVGQIDIVALSPYQIAGPVKETFYGRESQIRLIMSALRRPGARCQAVIGPRRIGKTSLLLRVKQEIQNEGFRTFFLDSMPLGTNVFDWQRAILRGLGIPEQGLELKDLVSSIKGYCKANKCKLVLFIDEVDDLLRADEKNDLIFFKTLRALINEAEVKLLIAGYMVLYFQMYDKKSPLYNMLEPIELSSLEVKDSLRLIEEPLRDLFHIEKGDMVHIHEQTAGYPNFIQFCCRQLVEHCMGRAEPRRRTITRSDIKRVLMGKELFDFMVGVHLDNLDAQSKTLLYLMVAHYNRELNMIVTDPRAHDRAVTSEYARDRHRYEIGSRFTPYVLHRLLELHEVHLSREQLETIMKKLVLATILRREEQSKEYSFIIPYIPEIMSQHVEVELAAVNLLEWVHQSFDGR